MLKSFLNITWRSLRKNEVFSLLNVIGLASGLLCSLLIYLWVLDEKATDQHHDNIDQIFSVYEQTTIDETSIGSYLTPALLYQELKLKIPEIKNSTVLSSSKDRTFSIEDKVFKHTGNFASEDYFKLFSYDFLQGNADSALSAPNKIALSRKMAEQFFGNVENAMGKTLIYQNFNEFQVSAVYEEGGQAISQRNDFYINWAFHLNEDPLAEFWENNESFTYIQIKKDSDAQLVAAHIKDFLRDYNGMLNESFKIELFLQPYADKYLHAHFEDGLISGGRIENVRIFGFIAFFILLIACINFMNLASAGALNRAKEVAVRKAMGAEKGSLILQFLGEAILLTLLSAAFALLILAIILPDFNQIADKNIDLQSLPLDAWMGILGVILLTGIIAGSYPAFMLSSLRSIDIFKKVYPINVWSKWIRQGLVVFQFSLSIILISGMLITARQINYIYNKNLGFDRQNLLTFPLEGTLSYIYQDFKNQALEIPGIESLSISSINPLDIDNMTVDINWQGKADNDITGFTHLAVGADFAKTWGSEILLGSDFTIETGVGYILNETALLAMELEDPIGQPLSQWGEEGLIVGIIKDFHYNSLKEKIEPLVLRNGENASIGHIIVRIGSENVDDIISDLTRLLKKMNPDFPLKYAFTNQEYERIYKSETIFYKLSQYFSLMAIFISCLGLFGLVMFTAEQKMKEIGLRKILGGSIIDLCLLMAKDFLKLVLLGILIGSPVSWFLMNQWLSNFEYRISMPWWAFLIAGLIAISIALLTLSYQTIKVALANPVKSLQSE